MKIKVLALACLSFVIFSGCKDSGKQQTPVNDLQDEMPQNEWKDTQTDPVADPAHNSRNSLDWMGTYHGTLPCADCPGIETTLELDENMTYRIRMIYLDRDTEIEGEGKFEWDDSGQKITLQPEDKDEPAFQFFVGENQLFTLDQEGNRITGELADKYNLEKY